MCIKVSLAVFELYETKSGVDCFAFTLSGLGRPQVENPRKGNFYSLRKGESKCGDESVKNPHFSVLIVEVLPKPGSRCVI